MMRSAAHTRQSLTRVGVVIVASIAVLALSGCDGAGGNSASSGSKGPKGSKKPADATLIIDGKEVESDGLPAKRPLPIGASVTDASDERAQQDLAELVVETDVPPTLLDDGTIDDGDDPFDLGSAGVPPLPLPIEDDPELTEALDTWNRTQIPNLERIDPEAYATWQARGVTLHTPTRDDAADPTAPYVVRVLAKRCGGAITTASGVLVGGGLVVTTVHAVESVARRVRVQMATSGSTRRYPAMIQYLDVDDDIAVLRVPGLEDAGGISRLADATSTNPSYGFALGIDDDGRGLRRVPIVLGGERLSATIEQPDGFGREITDRDVLPMLGGISTGFSGAPVVLSQSGDAGPWLLAGIVRARIPFRALTGSVVIPVELINEAIDARGANPEWSELVPNPRCSQWARLQS